MSAAEFVYTFFLRPRWMRRLVNRLILEVLPETVRVGEAIVSINPRDPVVSGALAFRIYERHEIALIRRFCQPGQVVVDIGANVGLYTALAGRLVGPSGAVFSFEPDPESFSFLQQTVRLNRLGNTHLVNAAVSRTTGRARLYRSTENRGDSRLYEYEGSDGSLEVDTLCLDEYLEAKAVGEVHVIKVDVQGYEGVVIDRLERTIRRSPRLRMLMEFFPTGLRQAGTDPLALLAKLQGWGLSGYEIKDDGTVAAVANFAPLVARLSGRAYTNLVWLGPAAQLETDARPSH
jgi:FkbM family methyltransferase